MTKKTVYVETSVVSYLTTRPTANHIGPGSKLGFADTSHEDRLPSVPSRSSCRRRFVWPDGNDQEARFRCGARPATLIAVLVLGFGGVRLSAADPVAVTRRRQGPTIRTVWLLRAVVMLPQSSEDRSFKTALARSSSLICAQNQPDVASMENVAINMAIQNHSPG